MGASVTGEGSSQIVVSEVTTQFIELTTAGPQGPIGPMGPAGADGATTMAALTDVNVSAKVNQSVLYWDAATEKWRGDDVNTVVTLTDGGNF